MKTLSLGAVCRVSGGFNLTTGLVRAELALEETLEPELRKLEYSKG